MTLEEAIIRYTDNAEYERTNGNLQGCLEFRQLAEWLKELRALRNGAIRIFDLLKGDSPKYVPNYDAYNLCLKLLLEEVDRTDIVLEVQDADSN